MSRVALALLGGQRLGDLDLEAAVLPQCDAAGHGLDVLVTELLKHRVRGERGALPGGAVGDHALRLVRCGAFDARLEMPARHVHGARQMRLLELMLLPDVDDDVAVVAIRDQLVDLARVYFGYLASDLADQVCAAGHLLETPKSRSVFTSLSVATQKWIEAPRRAPQILDPRHAAEGKLPRTFSHVSGVLAWVLHPILRTPAIAPAPRPAVSGPKRSARRRAVWYSSGSRLLPASSRGHGARRRAAASRDGSRSARSRCRGGRGHARRAAQRAPCAFASPRAPFRRGTTSRRCR